MDQPPTDEGRPDEQPSPPPPPPHTEQLSGDQFGTTIAPATPVKSLASRYAVIFLVLILIGAGVSAAFLVGSSSGPALETVTPSDVAVYVRVTVRPEGEQGDSLRALLSKVPSQARDGLGSRFDSLFQAAAGKAGFDYTKDIKPWLGSQMAFTVRPSTAGPPATVALIQVKDEGAARATLTKIAARANGAAAFEIDNGVAYLAKSASEIAAFRSAAKSSPLSTDQKFAAAINKVGDGLFVIYFDGSKIGSLTQAFAGNPGIGPQISALLHLNGLISLQAKSDGIVLAGHLSGVPQLGLKTGRPALVESTSSGLLGEATLFDVGGLIERLQTFGGAIPGFAARRAELSAKVKALTGLDIERDVVPWLHGEMSIVVGGITPAAQDIALLIQPTDPTALTRTLVTLKAHAARLAAAMHSTVTAAGTGFDVKPPKGPTIAVRVGTDRLVVAANAAYAEELLKPSSQALANDLLYRELMGGSGNDVQTQIFVRLDRIRTLVEALLSGESRTNYEQNIKPFVEPFQALTARTTTSGDVSDFRFEISVSK